MDIKLNSLVGICTIDMESLACLCIGNFSVITWESDCVINLVSTFDGFWHLWAVDVWHKSDWILFSIAATEGCFERITWKHNESTTRLFECNFSIHFWFDDFVSLDSHGNLIGVQEASFSVWVGFVTFSQFSEWDGIFPGGSWLIITKISARFDVRSVIKACFSSSKSFSFTHLENDLDIIVIKALSLLSSDSMRSKNLWFISRLRLCQQAFLQQPFWSNNSVIVIYNKKEVFVFFTSLYFSFVLRAISSRLLQISVFASFTVNIFPSKLQIGVSTSFGGLTIRSHTSWNTLDLNLEVILEASLIQKSINRWNAQKCKCSLSKFVISPSSWGNFNFRCD